MDLRPTRPDDANSLAEIYGHAVLHGLGTFEETPPTIAEMDARRVRVADFGLPHVVAVIGGRVAGYSCAAPFRPRPGYRFTAEDSVYVAPWAVGRGVGRALLLRVVEDCEALGLRRLVAAIGDSKNVASIAMHQACGFAVAGVLPAVGWKFGRWVDVVFMQRGLNGGHSETPKAPGLDLREP